MSNSDKSDDDWAELARELERDNPSPPSPAQTPDEQAEMELGADDDEFSEGIGDGSDDSGSEEFDDSGEPGTEGESNEEPGTGDGQPGTGRKRRRRRRRRRKGGVGQPAEAGAAEEAAPPRLELPPENRAGEPEESELEAEPAIGEAEFGDYEEETDEYSAPSAAEAEEDAGGELLRELIANWNVPSWDDVVSGLYRPER